MTIAEGIVTTADEYVGEAEVSDRFQQIETEIKTCKEELAAQVAHLEEMLTQCCARLSSQLEAQETVYVSAENESIPLSDSEEPHKPDSSEQRQSEETSPPQVPPEGEKGSQSPPVSQPKQKKNPHHVVKGQGSKGKGQGIKKNPDKGNIGEIPKGQQKKA